MGIVLRWMAPDGRSVELRPSLVAAGLDFGFGDPLALEVGAKCGRVWLNVFEVYESRLSIPEVLRAVRHAVAKYRPDRVWADPEDPKMIQYLQAHGLPVLPVGVRDLDWGIRTVYGLLKEQTAHPVLGLGPRLRMDRRACPGLVGEFGRYGYPQTRGELRTGRPADRHNHALDALRYYLVGEGEMPPEERRPALVEQPRMYLDEAGRWRDNPRAHMAQVLAAQAEPGGWWDEEEAGDPSFVIEVEEGA